MPPAPQTRYAERDGLHLAYRVLGDGERDIFYLSLPSMPIDLMWDDPLMAHGLRRLAGLGRLIACDGRDWGSSDRVDQRSLPALQAWMDDVGIVLENLERAVGQGDISRLYAPSRSDDELFVRWSNRAERLSTPPNVAAGQYSLFVHADVRGVLGLASAAVPPLVVGSGIEFEDRGNHELKGVPGAWQLYRVTASS